jgi:hypothetical protein
VSLALFNQLLLYFPPRVSVAFRYDEGWSKQTAQPLALRLRISSTKVTIRKQPNIFTLALGALATQSCENTSGGYQHGYYNRNYYNGNAYTGGDSVATDDRRAPVYPD